MQLALFSLNKALNELFIETLFSRGITVYSSETVKNYVKTVMSKEVDCLFIDIDIKGVDWLKLIEFIKEKKAPRVLFIVVMTSSTDKSYLNRLILLGVNAIFDKKKSLKGYISKIEKLILLFEADIARTGEERRKFVRVKVREDEDIFVNIELAGKANLGSFKCRVMDISIIAVAFYIDDPELLKLIENKARSISNLQIIINKKVYFCAGELIRSKGRVAVARFDNPNNLFTLGIANYIYRKINT